MSLFLFFPILDKTGGGGGGIGGLSPNVSMILMFAMIFAVFYFLMIRPQRKKEQERQEMLSKIRKNDHVITTGGIHGVVMNVKEDEVVLKVDENSNTKIRFSKNAIAGVIRLEDEKEEGKK